MTIPDSKVTYWANYVLLLLGLDRSVYLLIITCCRIKVVSQPTWHFPLCFSRIFSNLRSLYLFNKYLKFLSVSNFFCQLFCFMISSSYIIQKVVVLSFGFNRNWSLDEPKSYKKPTFLNVNCNFINFSSHFQKPSTSILIWSSWIKR